MSKKEKENKKKTLADEINKQIDNLVEGTSDLSKEEEDAMKDELRKILIKKKSFPRMVLDSIIYFIRQFIIRYIILVLLVALFFNYLILANKYEIFLLDLFLSLFMTILGTLVAASSKFRIGRIFINLIIGLVFTLCIGILVNNYYPIFSSNLSLSIYLIISSVSYNIIYYGLMTRSLMKGI